MDEDLTAESLPDRLTTLKASMGLPGYLADLARLEWLLHQKKTGAEATKCPKGPDRCGKSNTHHRSLSAGSTWRN
jgi:hypothetical protein